jgi:hypothetical protein
MWRISIAHLNNPTGDIGERFGDHMVIHLKILKLVDQIGGNKVAWNLNPVRIWIAV